MQKHLTIILIILLYSCGEDSPTNPPSIDYHTDDQQFIDNLVLSNNSIENEDVIDRITTTDFIDDSTGSKYYKIKQLNLNNMSLDSIPNSIINLDSLKILYLSNNQIEFLPEDICNINDQLDSLDVSNNLLCNPHVPMCITNIEPTLTAFFASQNGCSYQMSPKDMNFIKRMILENWTAVSENNSKYDSLWTIFNDENNITWQEFIEEDKELQFILSHELAHNSEKHISKRVNNSILGTILDVAAASAGVNTRGTFGNIGAQMYSQDFEREADYISMYILALAEIDTRGVENFWRRLSAENPRSIDSYNSSHPTSPERWANIVATRKEIEYKINNNIELVPERKDKS